MRAGLRSLWLSYLAAEREGYRPRYLAALSELLDAVASVAERDELALTALRAFDAQASDLTLRDPLQVQVLRPFMEDHITEPQVIWWAMQTRIAHYELLEMFSRYDRIGSNGRAGAITYALDLTGEARWWRMLLSHRLAVVEYATHHLDEGRGLVDDDIEHCVLQTSAAIAIVDQAPAGVVDQRRRVETVQTWSLLRDWMRYDAAGRPGDDFPGWCREQGSEHWVARNTGSRHYYYQR